MTHDVNVKLTRKTPDSLTYDEIKYTAKPKTEVKKQTVNGTVKSANETFPREFSYTLNDYMLARGFAAVYAAGIGTMDSDGFRTCGSKEETESTTAIIEWLAGNRKAFIDKTSGIEIKAWWCNKHVAMTGKSYLGTLATAAATTGVEGLSTIISEAAISNWYDYYRDGGLVVAPGGFPVKTPTFWQKTASVVASNPAISCTSKKIGRTISQKSRAVRIGQPAATTRFGMQETT